MKYKDLYLICYGSRDLLEKCTECIVVRLGYAKDIDTLIRTIIKFGISVFRYNEDFRVMRRKLYIGEDQDYKFYIGFDDLKTLKTWYQPTNMRGVVDIIGVRLLRARKK